MWLVRVGGCGDGWEGVAGCKGVVCEDGSVW